MNLVYLGIGSNLGEKEKNINKAINLVSLEVGDVLNVSSFYYSEPLGFESDNDFVNVVVSLFTEFSPDILLEKLQKIETKMGRQKNEQVRYTDRVIDLDILTYNNLVSNAPDLQIPHPKMIERDFVLIPFAEISPEFVHPKEDKTISELQKELKKSQLKEGYLTRNFEVETKRYCQTLELKDNPELIEKYKIKHSKREIWAEIPKGIREVGILEMEIYLFENKLFMIVETALDFEWDKAFEKLSKLPRQKEWEERMSIFQQATSNASSSEKWQLMERIFQLYD